MTKTRVAIVGATGYGGAEIVRLLSSHSGVKIVAATSGRLAGTPLRDDCPWLDTDLVLQAPDLDAIEADVFFLCQEAGYAMDHAASLLGRAKVIDLSADFRLQDLEVYAKTYGFEHRAPSQQAVYGLTEFHRDEIAEAKLIANPGCYPTASLLGLLPLLQSGLVPDGAVAVLDGKSGVSGAGRAKRDTAFTFSELSGGSKAYAAVGHRHVPEIEQAAGIRVRFTPHLLPTARGMEVTLTLPVPKTNREELRDLYRDRYANESFVRVVAAPPSIKQVLGSNRADVFVDYDAHVEMAVVSVVIDNLGKGAAGQAVQNMNVMCGFGEDEGLPKHGVWP